MKALALVVVPRWENHTWYTHLLEKASHRFSFNLGEQLWNQCSDREVDITHSAFIIDTSLKKRAHERQEIKIRVRQKGRERPPERF